jgi:hypothetical protein
MAQHCRTVLRKVAKHEMSNLGVFAIFLKAARDKRLSERKGIKGGNAKPEACRGDYENAWKDFLQVRVAEEASPGLISISLCLNFWVFHLTFLAEQRSRLIESPMPLKRPGFGEQVTSEVYVNSQGDTLSEEGLILLGTLTGNWLTYLYIELHKYTNDPEPCAGSTSPLPQLFAPEPDLKAARVEIHNI